MSTNDPQPPVRRMFGGTTEAVKQRHIRNCALADPEYREGVAAAPERQALANVNGLFNFI